MYWSIYTCDINTEPLHRYQRGGYHPVHLGDYLNNGRYKILHKLGWGGYSSVWVARDTRSRFLSCIDTVKTGIVLDIKPTLL